MTTTPRALSESKQAANKLRAWASAERHKNGDPEMVLDMKEAADILDRLRADSGTVADWSPPLFDGTPGHIALARAAEAYCKTASEYLAKNAPTSSAPAAEGARGTFIRLRETEIQSGLDRVRWAEGLIRQLPENHDGRNSWLLNYAGDKHAADKCASPPSAIRYPELMSRLAARIRLITGTVSEDEKFILYIADTLRDANAPPSAAVRALRDAPDIAFHYPDEFFRLYTKWFEEMRRAAIASATPAKREP